MSTQLEERLDGLLSNVPIVAILRGVQPDEAEAVVAGLFAAGIRVAEVPLNSPQAYVTIARIAKRFGEEMMIGAGTVTSIEEVQRLAETGCSIVVSPNSDPEVIRAALALRMVPIPGFSTASEAFTAIAAGARFLKFFPAAGHEADYAAIRTVLPKTTQVIAVGGVSADTIPALRASGLAAFGIGSDLYSPGLSADVVQRRATTLVAAVHSAGRRVRLVANRNTLIGESPLMDGCGDILWVDPMGPTLHRADLETGIGTALGLAEPVWSIARRGDELVGTVDGGFVAIDPQRGDLVRLATVELEAGCRLNDMVVDPQGGLWAGSMHRGVLAATGALFHAPLGSDRARTVARGLGVANGMAFSLDGRLLYVIDTLSRTLVVYPRCVKTDALGEPSIVTDFMGVPGKPDGMTIAPDGSLWVAMWGGGCVVRIAQNGPLLDQIDIPAPNVGSLCLTDDMLFISTARARLSPAQLEKWPHSGGLFAARIVL